MIVPKVNGKKSKVVPVLDSLRTTPYEGVDV
jgi:hypothetical protein